MTLWLQNEFSLFLLNEAISENLQFWMKYNKIRLIEPRIIKTIGLLKQTALERVGYRLIH